ncbi:MAG: Phosphate acyltransferase [Chlamydiae bacterium]|nr:Phosphate acyltransferase [Chlamydiota bacterium]
MLRLVVDIMGSDSDPLDLFQGVIQAADLFGADCHFTVLATKQIINRCNENFKELSSSIQLEEAEEEVLMEDSPLLVVRRKHKSSMALGVGKLKDKSCDGLITAGNTGAITAFATLELKKLPTIERPALLATLPTERGKVAILDVGANITFRPRYLMQFALMGAIYQKIEQGISDPKIGLLNIGGEARKGTRVVRQAYDYFNHYAERLEEKNLHFEGNIEARDVFEGKVDVIVADGFTGNVFLKTCEGVSSFIVDQISKRFSNLPFINPKKQFQQLEKYLDYAEYPGAVMLGVDSVIVKCHGCSSSLAMFNGIKGAYHLAKNKIIGKIEDQLKEFQTEFSELATI